MKKYLTLLLIVVVAITMAGCGKKKDESAPKKVTNKTTISAKANISEEVILDEKGVKVTAKGISYSNAHTEIKVLIENNSEEDLLFQLDNFSINDLMLSPGFYANVTAGKKSNEVITLYNEDLKTSNITTIKDIEFKLVVVQAGTYDTFTEKEVKLTTDAKNYTQEYNTKGTLVVDDKDIKVYVLDKKKDSKYGYVYINVYVENNSDRKITVTSDDESVDGFMMDASLYTRVSPGKKAYDYIEIDKDDLEENDLKDVSKLELVFDIYDSEAYTDILETDKITLEF